jgi:hypothetical protein
MNSPFFRIQSWLKRSEQINCPAPLLEGPREGRLAALLAAAPYEAPEKKEKKKDKETREGLRPRGPTDSRSGDTHAPSAPEGEKDQEEVEEEDDSSRTRKRVASEDVGEVQPPPAPKRPCKVKIVLSDDSSASAKGSEASEEVPRRTRRAKPRAQRYVFLRCTHPALAKLGPFIDYALAFKIAAHCATSRLTMPWKGTLHQPSWGKVELSRAHHLLQSTKWLRRFYQGGPLLCRAQKEGPMSQWPR